ncbi:MAG TPA: hypothetical protein DCZ95_13970 [Verrucomicrobia bacterium]|nr:MAG: hypothetical protein A2X46_12945 [Lentisphaerae bacterium GWF2_57_35]HBA85191.1 hypothetical protein [Verrucomicrobiota bacterium]
MHLGWLELWKGSWIFVVLALAWAYIRYFEWSHFFVPRRAIVLTPADVGLEFEDVSFVAEDGCVLNGWWIPYPEARGTLIYCHGNASNLGDLTGVIADLRRLRVNLFAFDYRGYGKSRGLPTEKGLYRDARAAYEVVRARYADVDAPPVVVYGHSLGGAVAVQLASDKPVRGVMVEGTFSSSADMSRSIYSTIPVHWILHYRFDSLSKVGALRMPKLFGHTRQDETVPYALGRKLFEAAAEPKRFVELPGDHNTANWAMSRETWQALESFVMEVLG